MTLRVLVRGGGDLASGVVLRLARAGWQVLITELAQPLAVRRTVSFAQAVYDGRIRVEDVTAWRVADLGEAQLAWQAGAVAVMVDPDSESRTDFRPHVLIDGRMRKQPPDLGRSAAPLVIGLGPGFSAGEDCHAVVETNRGPSLGRVYWQGTAQEDTGIPEGVGGRAAERVLRAPAHGVLETSVQIGDRVQAGSVTARVGGVAIVAPFDGVIRGMAQPGIVVNAGEKVGDLDPRSDPRLCWLVSDKALAVGGGVLEAILSFAPLRPALWGVDG